MNETDGPLPLPTLLSHALVAFTIEFDNEFEHRMPHRSTADAGSGAGPWLTSMAMWTSCMRYLDDSGMRVRDLEDLARAKTNLDGMRRWGYIQLARDPADQRSKPPSSDLMIRPTRAGRVAQQVWRPLAGEIEKRWCARFGRGTIDQLRKDLGALAAQSQIPLPDSLPILEYGLWTRSALLVRRPGQAGLRASTPTPTPTPTPTATPTPAPVLAPAPAPARATVAVTPEVPNQDLPTLLSRVLLGFALAYERDSMVSMAVGANVLRILNEKGVRVRDLPQLTGVAKPGIDMVLGILQKQYLAEVGTDPAGGRWKVIRLTPEGHHAQDAHWERVATVENNARTRFGAPAIDAVRRSLEPLVGDPIGQRSPLYGGLAPYPDGWRAKVREADTLPYFPVILHRGGYPDGS